jgi:endo-1,4-beta-D-glucanase Y
MKRREFSKYAAAGAVVAGAAAFAAHPIHLKPTPAPTPAPTPSPTSAPAPAPAPTPAPTPAPAPAPSATGGLGYPFGARLAAYAAGTKPSQSNATMDAMLTKQYDAWKAARVVNAGSVVAGGYAVQFSDTTYMTVSEGMGYGMLMAVLFAGHDANARQLFDGLLAVVRTRYSYGIVPYDPNGKYLMDWRLNADGSSAGGGWNAMDGDLDIAMALLMADKQWGSTTGTWNYLQEAKNTIAGLKSWCMKPDGTTKGLKTADVSRTSDYMIGHFRAFAAATGDSFWNTAIDRAYWLTNLMQTSYSANVGLVPDFIVATNTTSPYPSPGYMGDGDAYENDYWWNACRNPWRYASDYVLSGDSRWQQVAGKVVGFFQSQVNAAGGDVTVIGTGYNLAGAKLTGGNSAAYHAPLCAGACVSSQYQTFVDALWNWNAAHLTTGYYDSELQLLSLVVASGNWWSPLGTTAAVSGSTSTSTSTTQTSTTTTTTSSSSLLANGDFSAGMGGWADWGNTTIVSGALNVGTNAGGCGQDIATKVTAGKTYLLTGTANITAAAEGVFVGVKLMDVNGAALVNQTQLVSSTSPTAVSIQFTVPAGVASGNVFVWKNANSAMGVVDNLSLVAV